MTDDTKPLSLRQERFGAEYFKDSNATRRERMTEALDVSVERLAQEYAKMAFARIEDFVSTDQDGRVRTDLKKASQAQRAGIVELKITSNSKGEQKVTLKLGKLQALNALANSIGLLVAKPRPGLTAEDRQRYEERLKHYEDAIQHSKAEQRRLEQEVREARVALEAAETKLKAPGIELPNPSIFRHPGQSSQPGRRRTLGALPIPRKRDPR